MPKKYIHNKPGVGPNKVPPSWLDRDEDKVPACAMPNWHAGVYAARLRRSWTFCPKSALCSVQKNKPKYWLGAKTPREFGRRWLLRHCSCHAFCRRRHHARTLAFSVRIVHSRSLRPHTRTHTTGSAACALRW